MDVTYTVKEFADALNVSHDTVTRWVRAGKVQGKKSGVFPGKTNAILIPASELTRVKKLMNASAKAAKNVR